jgi:hypothetical protein
MHELCDPTIDLIKEINLKIKLAEDLLNEVNTQKLITCIKGYCIVPIISWWINVCPAHGSPAQHDVYIRRLTENYVHCFRKWFI